MAGSSLSASPALGLGSSLGSFAPAAAAGGKTTKEEKRETTHLNTTHSKQIKGSAAKYSVSPDGHHRVDSTLHDDLRRSEFSNTSLIGVPSGEPTTENDMYRYEPTPLNLLPDPLVSLPIVTFDPLPADLASAAIRSLDTASQVFDLASGGVVQLSKRAEQIIAAEDTNHAHYEHALDECGLESDSDVSSAGTSSVTVASVLKLLARIYSIWNTPLEIPLLQFDPTIQRGSIIGGQLACTPSAYPASGGVPSASPFAPAAHHPFVRTPTNTKIKQDPKPPAVGEYVAYLKLWEGELVRDAHLYMLASHRAHLLAARDSVRIFENLISVAVTRGTFSASVYGQQDLYLLDRHRLESLEPIRAAMKRAALGSAGMGIDRTRRTHSHAHAFNGDILAQSVEEELLHRFSAIRADLSTHALFQSSFDPIDFSLDIAAELNRYIQGTRMAMCRAFWQFIHTNDAMPSYEEEMAEHSEDTLLRPSAAMLLRRVIWIRGASGVGKTCLSALLAEVFYDQMLAVYFVRHDRAARKSPARMIRSIAFQLSQRIPAFADELKVRLAKMARDTQRKQTTTNAETHLTPASMDLQPPIAYLDSLAPLDLFEQLLIQPLAAIKQPQFIAKNKKMVILVDAIDECEEARPGSSVDSVDPVARSSRSCAPVSPLLDNPLLSLLLQQVTRLPTWVGLCITSRPSEHIIRAIAKLRPTEISFESRDNAADLKKIVTTILEPVVAPNQLQQCANVILDKAQGAILYVRLVLDDKLPRLVAGDRVGSAHPTGVTSGHSPLIASKESSIILPVNARDDHPTRPTSPTSANGNANASAGVTLDPRPYSVTHADVSAFPDGLHAYYQDTFDRMAALMTSFKQPIAAVMQLVKLLVCAREPMSPALLAQLQYGSTGSKETAQTLTLRLMQPLRALMPYRVLDSRRVPRGKYSVVHKSVKDWLVDPTRAPLASRTATKKTMPTWFISLQKGHARLAEKCWNALLVKSPFHGSPSDGRAPGVSRGVGADFGAGGDSVHADACVVGAGGVTLSELPNGIIPIRAPMLNIDHAIKHADDTKHESKQDDDEPHSDGTGGMQSQRQILCQDSLLSYALRFGPSHGIASGDLCGTAAFLCHLQYLHMRTSLIGESSLCAIDYINAARQIHANARGWGEMKRNNANGVKLNKSTSAIHTPPCHAIQPESTQPNSWSWLSPADAAIGIIHFQSFYQSELPHWLHRHELIYQYALAFPDATLVCRVARSLVGWYLSEWPHRRMGLVYWNNKPQAIDALQITLRGHERGVTCIAYSPDGLSLASGSIDRSIRIWNGDTGELRTELKGHSYHVNCIAFSPDGKQIASGGSDNQIRLWDTFTGECTRILRGDDVWFHSVEFSPDGRKLCCGVSDWSVWMFDLATFEIDMRLDGHRDKIMDVAYSPDGKIIASASEDETIRIWAAASGRLVHEIREAHNKGVMSLDFDSAGVRLASVGMDGFIRLWSCDDWSLIRCVHAHPKGVIGVEFHPDQIRVVSCSYDRTVKMWNSLDGQLLHTLHGHLEEVNAIACAPNGVRIASASTDRVTTKKQTQSKPQKKGRTRGERTESHSHNLLLMHLSLSLSASLLFCGTVSSM